MILDVEVKTDTPNEEISYRLVKIKSELLNLLCVLPPHLLVWGSSRVRISSNSRDENPIGSCAEFVQRVHACSFAQEILDLIVSLEDALPCEFIAAYYSWKSLPVVASNLAVAAVRLYSLDRALRYRMFCVLLYSF